MDDVWGATKTKNLRVQTAPELEDAGMLKYQHIYIYIDNNSLSQWPSFKLLGMTYLYSRKNQSLNWYFMVRNG